MTNEPLAPGPDTFFVRQRVHLIGAFRWLYRLLTVVAIGIAVFRAYAAVRDRRMPGWTMATLLSVGSLLVLGRVVGLAYLDLTAFPAFAPTYLASAYAVLLVLGVTIALRDDRDGLPDPRSQTETEQTA
jgi:hypothetical protein